MKILVAGGDAGGARALIPVIRHLRSVSGIYIDCRAYAAAFEIWRASDFEPIPEKGSCDLSGIDCVLLGTSVQPEQYELGLIQKARANNIRTVSLLDFWFNYRERYTTFDGKFVLPDVIAVMDEKTREEMIACRFPPDCLVVTGQPVFDELKKFDGPEVREQTRLRIRRDMGYRSEDILILYASQPLSQLACNENIGYSEHQVLADFIEALQNVLSKRFAQATLLVKLHPREANVPFLLPPTQNANLRIILVKSDEIDRRALVSASDCVVGMNSMLLMEACYLRKVVLSYQPGMKKSDPLPCNRYGWSRPVYDRDELLGALDTELFHQDKKLDRSRLLQNVNPEEGATGKILDVLFAH